MTAKRRARVPKFEKKSTSSKARQPLSSAQHLVQSRHWQTWTDLSSDNFKALAYPANRAPKRLKYFKKRTTQPSCRQRSLQWRPGWFAGVGSAFFKKGCDCTMLIPSAKNKVLLCVNSLTPSGAGSVRFSPAKYGQSCCPEFFLDEPGLFCIYKIPCAAPLPF